MQWKTLIQNICESLIRDEFSFATVRHSLEDVLHEQPRHDAHGGGEGGRTHALLLQRPLVNLARHDQRRSALKGRTRLNAEQQTLVSVGFKRLCSRKLEHTMAIRRPSRVSQGELVDTRQLKEGKCWEETFLILLFNMAPIASWWLAASDWSI